MKLRELPYEVRFYWKGKKYRQILRIKNPPKGKFAVICQLLSNPQSKWMSFPAGRVVKPVIR